MFEKKFSDPEPSMRHAAAMASRQMTGGARGTWQWRTSTTPQQPDQAARPGESPKDEDWAGECMFDWYNN